MASLKLTSIKGNKHHSTPNKTYLSKFIASKIHNTSKPSGKFLEHLYYFIRHKFEDSKYIFITCNKNLTKWWLYSFHLKFYLVFNLKYSEIDEDH